MPRLAWPVRGSRAPMMRDPPSASRFFTQQRETEANMRRLSIISALALALAIGLLGLVAAPAAQADETRVVRYGPFTIPAGTMDAPGMLHNQLRLAVSRACLDCYITSMTPDLVYADGTKATMADGPMLHHAVWTSQWRSDATCS